MSRMSRGRTSKTRGVNDRLLRASAPMVHQDASPQALLTPDAIRAILDALMCPFCSRGPFKMPLGHIASMHGYDREEMRDMAGLPLSAKLTSPELSDSISSRMRAKPNLTPEMVARGVALRATYGRRQSVALVNAKLNPSTSARGREATIANKAAVTSSMIEAWEASEKTYVAIGVIAEQFKVTRKNLSQRLRSNGVEVEDGRAGSELKRKPQPRKPCTIGECGKPSVARGLCESHYRAFARDENITNRPPCTLPGCGKPNVAKGLCSTHYAQSRR